MNDEHIRRPEYGYNLHDLPDAPEVQQLVLARTLSALDHRLGLALPVAASVLTLVIWAQ